VTPFSALVFRAALLDIPSDLIEQASVDGASRAQRFFTVTVPLLRPTTLVLASLIVVYAFKSFDFIYVMTLGGPGTASSTLPYLGWSLAFTTFEYSQGAAVAVISMAVVSIFAIFYARSVRDEVHP
jgi:multiple sugar transport system permease protein